MAGPRTEIALLLLIAALAGALFVRLRQPVPIAYIVVGLKLDLHLRQIGPVASATGLAPRTLTIARRVGVEATRGAWPWPSWCCPWPLRCTDGACRASTRTGRGRARFC